MPLLPPGQPSNPDGTWRDTGTEYGGKVASCRVWYVDRTTVVGWSGPDVGVAAIKWYLVDGNQGWTYGFDIYRHPDYPGRPKYGKMMRDAEWEAYLAEILRAGS